MPQVIALEGFTPLTVEQLYNLNHQSCLWKVYGEINALVSFGNRCYQIVALNCLNIINIVYK